MHKYQILDIIDEGAYGIVWKAINKQTQEPVAIKQFKQTDEDEETKRTIQRQIRMLKMLKGDYVVGIKQAFKKKGKIYLIFQFFPKNLLNVIQVYNQGLQPELIKQVVYKVVKCLYFLHNKNVIHRDIKPENILLNETNQKLKLCDLGFARFIPQNIKSMTDYVATRWYRSPQLLVGQPYGKPADMFALGCIIGQLVDGQPMFPGEDQVDQIFLLKKYIGQLTANQYRCLFENHKFSAVQIPQVKKRQTLQQRYLGKIQKNALSFLKACLKLDAQQRLTAQKALKHPYLIELSSKDKQFQNDEQNLLKQDRKTVPKNDVKPAKIDMRASVSSLPKQDQQTRTAQQSIILAKNKSFSKIQHNLKKNYGSVDYTSSVKGSNNLSQFVNNQILQKKVSQQNLIKIKDHSPNNAQQKTGKLNKKGLKKNMSQQKHLRLNLDVNVNINLKINKQRKIYATQHENDSKIHKLPELKTNNSKSIISRNKGGLAGLNRRISQRNNLTIMGQSKQISKQLLNKKLAGLVN